MKNFGLVQLRPWLSKSLDLQISSLVGYFKKINAFPVYAMCYHENVHNKINGIADMMKALGKVKMA